MTKLILLINLGTPEHPTPTSVKKYLAEFLSDPRVVELPKILWQAILHGIVLNIRPKKSAELYQKIWTPEGSPLMVGTKKLLNKMDSCFHRNDTTVFFDFAMRYGSPNVATVLKSYQTSVQEIIALPLYPQYASASSGSSLEAVLKEIKTWRNIPSVTCIHSYYNHPLYIEALAKTLEQHWQKNGRAQKLILSYHGIPQRSVKLGDPYFEECKATTELLAKKLALTKNDYAMVFQSRFGKAQWLQPYCAETLQSLPKQGIDSVDVICPGFAIDCLETLEEINIQNRKLFLQAGGKSFHYIPCLNDSDEQATFLLKICAN